MNRPFFLDDLVQGLDVPGVRAVALMGSYARGEAGPYSDLDLVRLVDGTAQGSVAEEHRLEGGLLIVVSTVTPAHVEEWFSAPAVAVNVILAVRQARALQDREGYFAAIQARASAFTWDGRMQERANRWASQQMVGWIEEVHKGIEGLRRNDIGRLLNARFGLSWGLCRVVTVQRGILLTGDNAFYDAIAASMGSQREWIRLCRTAFGIEAEDGQAPTLREQVAAGLRLYMLTADVLGPALCAQDLSLITQTCALINTILGQS
jgi:predicted nucleotidyltransferase